MSTQQSELPIEQHQEPTVAWEARSYGGLGRARRHVRADFITALARFRNNGIPRINTERENHAAPSLPEQALCNATRRKRSEQQGIISVQSTCGHSPACFFCVLSVAPRCHGGFTAPGTSRGEPTPCFSLFLSAWGPLPATAATIFQASGQRSLGGHFRQKME